MSTSRSGDASARPARKQISYGELERIRAESERIEGEGMIYNVWYNKMSGGDTGHGYEYKYKAKTRCDIARDAGYTRADMRIRASAGGVSDTTYVCLFFARGCCPKGYVVHLTAARSATFCTACPGRRTCRTKAPTCLGAKSTEATAMTWAASVRCYV